MATSRGGSLLVTQGWLRADTAVLAVLVYALSEASRLQEVPAPGGHQAVPPQAIPVAGARAEEPEFRAPVQRYYGAVARKDIAAVERGSWRA